MPFAETTIPIQLDRKRVMVFNSNTMAAYEQATGKFFLDVIAILYDVNLKIQELRLELEASPEWEALTEEERKRRFGTAAFKIVATHVRVEDLRAIVWAAIHEYDRDDVPTWPLSIHKIGRLLGTEMLVGLVPLIVRGQAENSPSKEEAGESARPDTVAESAATSPHVNGGASGFALDVGAFDLPIENSAG